MVDVMVDCMEAYPAYKLNNAFLTLFNNYNSILEKDGENHYKIKHMSKDKLMRNGSLPTCIEVTDKHINPEKYYNEKVLAITEDKWELNIASSDDEDSTAIPDDLSLDND